MEKHTYEIVNGFWDKGTWRAVGAPNLVMTERAARAHVLAGELRLVQAPVEAPSNNAQA
ncbi:MAG: hypothetical protein ABL893_10835 [Hyphomicrobium sp.]